MRPNGSCFYRQWIVWIISVKIHRDILPYLNYMLAADIYRRSITDFEIVALDEFCIEVRSEEFFALFAVFRHHFVIHNVLRKILRLVLDVAETILFKTLVCPVAHAMYCHAPFVPLYISGLYLVQVHVHGGKGGGVEKERFLMLVQREVCDEVDVCLDVVLGGGHVSCTTEICHWNHQKSGT